MTEKRFTLNRVGRERIIDGIIDNKTDELLDNQMDFCEKLNALHEENQLIKKHIRELYKFVKIDVDNEIEVYPSALLEGIVDILKIIGDFE